MKNEISYSDFCVLLSEDAEDRFISVLDYDDFQVWKDVQTGRYYYLECSENDASDFFEVELVAELSYSIMHDLNVNKTSAGEELARLFDCCCCGEMIDEDKIRYLWFEEKNKERTI